MGICICIWGHKFEPRYDEREHANVPELLKLYEVMCKQPEGVRFPRSELIVRVYVHDVCTRCGQTADRLDK